MNLKLTINENMGKDEELHILNVLVEAFVKHPNNYLAGLFTPKLFDWATRQVRADFTLDVMEYVSLTKEQDLELRISTLESELESRVAEINTLIDQKQQLEAEMQVALRANNELSRKCDEKGDTITNLTHETKALNAMLTDINKVVKKVAKAKSVQAIRVMDNNEFDDILIVGEQIDHALSKERQDVIEGWVGKRVVTAMMNGCSGIEVRRAVVFEVSEEKDHA